MPSPYLPNTNDTRQLMLEEIGIGSIDELFKDIPEEFRQTSFNLPPALSEQEIKKKLNRMARQNADLESYACFLGAGSYRHFIPGTVEHVTGRSEFYTAYTPYQAEVSQGTLQALYEYQSLICQLTGMEVSNAGMYDGGTAAAEAALMACRITKKNKAAVSATVNSAYREVIDVYLKGRNLCAETVEPYSTHLSKDCACLIVQQPNFFGYLEDIETCIQGAHDNGALFIAITTPISMGMFRPPGEYGADIVVAEGQPLGISMSFGGPYLGIFACRRKHIRQMPGRIVGRTVDTEGRPGYVMTLSTREQHIRRERATSNICTSNTLLAISAAVYLAALGKQGLRQVAELCYHKSHYAAEAISKLKGYSLAFTKPFFNEFVVICPLAPREVNRALFKEGIIGGLDISQIVNNGMLFCITEMNTRDEIDRLVETLGRLQGN